MHSVSIHQTSGHAVLIVHLHSIDPASVTQQISNSQNSAEISFKRTSKCDNTSHIESTAASMLTTTTTTVLVQPVLHIQEQPLTKDLIKESTFSVSPENIVIRFKKVTPCEWQALQLQFRIFESESNGVSLSSLSHSEQALIEQEVEAQAKGEGVIEESSVLVKFVTVSNITSFQEAIQSQPLWDQTDTPSQGTNRQVVGNVQAKRVPGMNAIQMTAELVPFSS